MKAVENVTHNTNIIARIRSAIISSGTKIKLLWVPGHSNISGNELADCAARSAGTSPTTTLQVNDSRDLKKLVSSRIENEYSLKWHHFTHKYKEVNKHGLKVKYSICNSRQQTRAFTRLRIGHTNITHSHLLQNEAPPKCTACKVNLTVDHILDMCPIFNNIRRKYFHEKNPTSILEDSSEHNVTSLYKFLIECNLSDNI